MRLTLDPELEGGPAGLPDPARSCPQDQVGGQPGGWSLDALYRSQAGRLFRLFSRRAGREDAGDLVQETFTQFAFADAGQAQVIDCPEAYLTHVAGNLLRKRARTAMRHSAAFHVRADEVALVGEDLESALEARDMLNRLEAAMLGLKPMTREIYFAFRFNGYSRAEIAERTGLGVKAIDKHLGKATAHIRRTIGRR
ncbi:sigma-70 family RNA polymerase sigma factor [Sphingomonas sp. So64.6b]|uniref:RNA polymerase sigma factor n=1 Tax=Sphingomonas sp. So64.6b TaxID=2997354 RepID=UPI001604769A|nr:sigma-70 family RNA polymerase sigma factor [Sphingomonas sp. So64.6b]QNA83742.1 sigma-70 family RNA polymerase sigma factor [Sphingomonas sp. So64.6b]